MSTFCPLEVHSSNSLEAGPDIEAIRLLAAFLKTLDPVVFLVLSAGGLAPYFGPLGEVASHSLPHCVLSMCHRVIVSTPCEVENVLERSRGNRPQIHLNRTWTGDSNRSAPALI